jgi:hypothetical protein
MPKNSSETTLNICLIYNYEKTTFPFHPHCFDFSAFVLQKSSARNEGIGL